MAIQLNTGKQEFELIFDKNNVEKIYFNPCDPDLSPRLADFEARIKEKIKTLDDFKLNAEGTPEDINAIEKYREFRKIFDDEFNRAFNANISETVFKYCSPFAIINGDYYVMQFLTAITPEIEKRIKKSVSESNKKMQKYIGKYVK